MPSHKRLTVTDFIPASAPAREIPVSEASAGHKPVDSPARLLHAQLNAGIIAPWQDVAAQHNEPRYPGFVRLAISIVGIAVSWTTVFFIIELLR